MWQALRISRAPAAALAAIGAFWGAFAAWIPDFKIQAGVSDARFGTLMVLSAVGGMLAMSLVPRLSRVLGPVLLPLSAGLLSMAVFFPVGIAGPVSFGMTMLGIGFAMSLADMGANIRISDLEAVTGRALMNLNHAVFSLSLAASALLAGGLRGAGAGYWANAILLMVLSSALALLMLSRPLEHAEKAEAAAQSAPPWLAILPAAAILFLSFVAENGTESWSALHFERNLGAAAGQSAFGPAMFALTMGLGRLSGQLMAARLGEARLIAISVVLGAVGAMMVALAPAIQVALVGMAALGVGVAVVVPSANSLLGRAVSAGQRAGAISRAWMIGFTGFFIGPPLLGWIAGHASLRWSFAVIALMMLATLPALARLARARR